MADPKGCHLLLKVVHQPNLRGQTERGSYKAFVVWWCKINTVRWKTPYLFEKTTDIRSVNVDGSWAGRKAQLVRQKTRLHAFSCTSADRINMLMDDMWDNIDSPNENGPHWGLWIQRWISDDLCRSDLTQAGVDLSCHVQWRRGEAFSKELQDVILMEQRWRGMSYQHTHTHSIIYNQWFLNVK